MDTFHTTADNSWGLKPLIDVGELATYLGIPVSTIYDWRTRGLGPPAYRLGKHLKFAVSDVRDWILYTDETPFVPVHSRPTLSESKAAIEAGAEPSYSGTFVGTFWASSRTQRASRRSGASRSSLPLRSGRSVIANG